MKKILSLLLVGIMCFSVMFTGCAQENENANINDIDNEQINNEQVNDDVISEIKDAVGDKIDDVISTVLSRQQPSSQRVVELAEKGELGPEHLRNYADFMLYVNQDNPTIRVIRDELAPGRPKDLPLDLLFNVAGVLTMEDIDYYNLESHISGNDVYFTEYAYYKDAFEFNGEYGLFLQVYYTKPDAVESAYDFFMKTYYEMTRKYENFSEIYNIVEYNENILNYNSLLSIKESVVQSKYTIVPLSDNFVMRYNRDGDLDAVYVYINGIFIDVRYGHDVTFAKKIDDMGTGLLSTLLNKETVSTASAMLKDIIEKAEAME